MVTVPSLWVDTFEQYLYWPPIADPGKIKKLMAEGVSPTIKWRKYGNAKVLFSGMYNYHDNELLVYKLSFNTIQYFSEINVFTNCLEYPECLNFI